ncbi:MAG: DeoR/GlpR transcriptional regulator [Anaerolineales bacterium]|nr:DeoR/GlpR transcriptional regulator [Anaerolineales bacterium]
MFKDIENRLSENGNLIPAQRYDLIQKHLAAYKIATYASLAELLNVSESTVRRDLEWMEDQGILERTRGGAILNQHIRAEAEYIQRAQRFIEEKRSIGKAAATLLEPGDVVFMNSGTTTAQIIEHINGVPNVTVITNNTFPLTKSHDLDFELVVIGGTYLPLSKSIIGPFSADNINRLYATKCFIGVEGISLKYGCTVSTFPEAEIIRMMVEHTQEQVVMVADHTKWGAVSNHLIARIDQMHTLVTDDGFDVNARISLLGRSVDVIIASKTKSN